MAKRKQYPLRIDADVWAGIERWAAQVEFILRRALKEAGRLKEPKPAGGEEPSDDE